MNTNENKSLWPDFNFDEVKTPLAILQEQANELGYKTKNIITGEIITTESFDEKENQMVLIYQFYIKAPILSNYRYLLFRLLQRNSLYPVDIYFDPDKIKIENIKEEEFLDKLKDIFSHPKTEETVKSLYAQSIQMKSNTSL